MTSLSIFDWQDSSKSTNEFDYKEGQNSIDRANTNIHVVYNLFINYKKKCDQLIETGRVRQSAVIHCQIRPVYSKSGVIAYVRFPHATN